MENASKALLIAAEVLIGVIVLSIFAYVFQKVGSFAESYQNNAEQKKIVAFNTQYIKYVTGTGKYIYSEDVVTLTEQVLNWNQTTVIDSEKIRLIILDERGGLLYSTQTQINYKFDRTTFLDDYKLRGDPSHANEKEYKFSCDVGINSSSGRVDEITIQIQGIRNN